MTVLITLTTAGSDTGPFDLYSDADGFLVPFETNVPKASLVSGYTSVLVPAGSLVIRVKSDSICTNYIDLFIGTPTTTTSTSSSTTTTSSSSTTTTTTTLALGYEYRLFGYANNREDACGQIGSPTGSYVSLGSPELTVWSDSPTLAGVALFYNNYPPLANPYINSAIGNGDIVLFALASDVNEKWSGSYNNTTGAIGEVEIPADCTP